MSARQESSDSKVWAGFALPGTVWLVLLFVVPAYAILAVAFGSIDPILRILPKIEKPVYAVSPIIKGETVKGPAAKMYRELGIEPSAFAVANHYRGLATGFVLDTVDAQLNESVRGLNMRTLVTNTLMKSHDDRQRLANDILKFIREVL